ncbi:ATP-dependent DNA helicase [Trichonephila clavipes]|uniref:ATP-dependent DNA helicase n=1 Tax=Trichonephila clavipes TaxID=2585209 RepID=A0A8X6S7Q2_TRICX|nr:ATP-dependent DNA helicase [Trichonephila clavipes]
MQIRRLRHVHGQFGILGQIINLPVSINTMFNRLSRNVDDDYCINVHIKRMKIHRTIYLMGLVTKRTIKAWLQYLVATPLYRMYDVAIDDSFFNLNQSTSQVPQDEISENITIEESLTAQQQTLLWNEEKYLRNSPGEANVPRSFLFDEHAEEFAFPAIYLGHFRYFREGIRVTPFMIATSELRRVDRHGVTAQDLLYMAMKIMRLKECLNFI